MEKILIEKIGALLEPMGYLKLKDETVWVVRKDGFYISVATNLKPVQYMSSTIHLGVAFPWGFDSSSVWPSVGFGPSTEITDVANFVNETIEEDVDEIVEVIRRRLEEYNEIKTLSDVLNHLELTEVMIKKGYSKVFYAAVMHALLGNREKAAELFNNYIHAVERLSKKDFGSYVSEAKEYIRMFEAGDEKFKAFLEEKAKTFNDMILESTRL